MLIEIVVFPEAIELRIEDDGVGFSLEEITSKESQHRLGLISMQERADMLGGSMEVGSAPNEGTSLQVRIPFDVENES